jgi:hypothetical protein
MGRPFLGVVTFLAFFAASALHGEVQPTTGNHRL